MEFLEHFVLPATGHYLDLLEVLAVLTYVIHLPYVGVVLGATGLSMWLTFRDREAPDSRFERFAGDLVGTFLTNRLAMIVLGVLPLFLLPLIYLQWFAGLDATPLKYIPLTIPLSAAGMFAVFLYGRSYASRKTNFETHMMFGMAGVGALKLSYLILFASVARLHDPEKWFRVKNILIMVLNWNVIWKFAFFMHAAMAITGAAILFFFFAWPGRDISDDPEYAKFVKKFAAGLALAFTLAMPVFNLFYVFTTPDVAFDNGVYLVATALVFACMIAACMLIGTLTSDTVKWRSAALVTILAVFTLSSVGDLRSMAIANYENAYLIGKASQDAKDARSAEFEAKLSASGGADVGAEVFKNTCMQCHRMDENLVGPAFNDVLPKYDIESLRAFVASPSRVDPNFPPMPNPGLTSGQISAVANYLLGVPDDTAAPESGH